MKTKRYIPESMDRTFICLGKEGEGNHLALHFDTAYWREEYPEAEILLWVAPPRGEGYMAALEERSGDVIWTVTAADTATEGQGLIELILRDAGSGTTIKSATARTLIRCSPSSKEPAEPPQAHRPWWERVLSMIRGFVKTVNGVKPDENGNVTIEAGGVKEEQGTENAGKLLYVGEDGRVKVLTLGEGLEIIDGMLTVTSAQVARAICGEAVCGTVVCGGG